MTRDYAQEVRDRMDELGRLPDRYHQTLVYGELNVCRVTSIHTDGELRYTYHLSRDCDTTGERWDHDSLICEQSTSDRQALERFTTRVRHLGHNLMNGQSSDTDRLAALAKWYDDNPNERTD